jgi:hypothetical protein
MAKCIRNFKDVDYTFIDYANCSVVAVYDSTGNHFIGDISGVTVKEIKKMDDDAFNRFGWATIDRLLGNK